MTDPTKTPIPTEPNRAPVPDDERFGYGSEIYAPGEGNDTAVIGNDEPGADRPDGEPDAGR